MRCADGYREGTKSIRRCVYRKQLDLDTLVCTRGPSCVLCARLVEVGGDGRVPPSTIPVYSNPMLERRWSAVRRK